jgi:hypothetical protein
VANVPPADLVQTKARILDEIKRTAHANGGAPLGRDRFEEETGIAESAWRGKFWARWGDAQKEAGFDPNLPPAAHEKIFLVERLAALAVQLKRFPTQAEVKLARRADPTFPSHNTFSKLGNVEQRIDLVRKLASEHAEFREALDYLPAPEAEPDDSAANAQSGRGDGSVYMLKLGKHYKIGKSFSVPRRHREITIELPEKPDVVHVITTDDPSGIEAYWHKRFADKRTNGEWFALAREEIGAFRRRKFM